MPLRSLIESTFRRLSVVCCFSAVTADASAQGVLNTQPGVSFESQSVSLELSSPGSAPILQFSFGFATDEVIQPGTIPDSFTITLQQPGGPTFLLLTADVTGVAWALPTPGTQFLDPDTIGRTAIPYPSRPPELAMKTSFIVEVPLPAIDGNQPATMYFDLFSNDNGIASQGWYAQVTVVPEPSTVVLFVMGGLFVGLRGWRRRRANDEAGNGPSDGVAK